MPFTPVAFLWMWLRGLLSLAIIVGAVTLLARWYDGLPREEPAVRSDDGSVVREARPLTGPRERLSAWRPGLDAETAMLAFGVLFLAWSLGGRFATPVIVRRGDPDEPNSTPAADVHRLKRPDGTELHIECYGPREAPPVVLTHGWGCDRTVWKYLRTRLADRARLIAWDLPGYGKSTRAANNDYSLERMAGDLRAVLDFAGTDRAVVVGHSMGGMTALTYCRLFPEELRRRVAALILVHTTYTNPLRTMQGAKIYTALQKPLLEPLLHVTIALSPVVWLMNWLSYLNGSAHWSVERQGFAGGETRAQLDFTARFLLTSSPAVEGRGAFGMLRYDASDVLEHIPVPTLVVAGDKDPVTLPQASEHIAARIPDSRLSTLRPAKHMGFIEHSSEFADLVAECCTSAESTPHATARD